ncbi:MAG: lysine--tRNA ligase [Pantoea sp. Brub]|nr:lysine--tRNA ligase [Pantoea sp. Brub]
MNHKKSLISAYTSKLNVELKERRNKLKKIREYGIPFPNTFRKSSTTKYIHTIYDKHSNEELTNLNIEVSVAGRMMSRRIMGKAAFVTLQDTDGKIQLYITCNNFADNFYDEQFKKWDIGDIIGASGKIFKTNTKELSINCFKLCLLTKSLRPLPDKFHGLVDQETRYRQRYLDLIINDKSNIIFKLRSKIINTIRTFMIKNNFLEVETPMLQAIPGGALARPFITHHNALNIDMYLRIAPELYLKRLVIGGFERVFEINRNFRNEGISSHHNPEFTMMELYIAYADYNDLMQIVESLLIYIAENVFETKIISYGQQSFDFSKSFERLTMVEAINKFYPIANSFDLNNFNKVKELAHYSGIKIENNWSLALILNEIFEKIIEKRLIQPTFVTDYPLEISPLARCNDNNPNIADRFELFIAGQELCNGFSELNDSEEQSKRFIHQCQNKSSGDKEAMFYDEDYILALEHGLPPTAGLGIGIDRLVMLFTNSQNIRDVILFPTLRPN